MGGEKEKFGTGLKLVSHKRLLCKVSPLVFLVSGGNRPVAAVIMINLLSPPGRGWADGGGGPPASQPSEYGRSQPGPGGSGL